MNEQRREALRSAVAAPRAFELRKAGNQIEQCRFVYVVGADDADDLAGRHPEGDLLDGAEATEGFRRAWRSLGEANFLTQ